MYVHYLVCNFAGWTPQTFTSSRKNRAEIKKQSILNFLDEDEKAVCSIILFRFCIYESNVYSGESRCGNINMR